MVDVAREVRMIEQMGVEIFTNMWLGEDFTLKALRAEGHDAVFLALGAPLGVGLGMPGEDAEGIFANTGGVAEAALRTVYEITTGRPLPMANLHVAPIAGLAGVKEASLLLDEPLPPWKFFEGVALSVAVANGLGNAQRVIAEITSGRKQYHFVEVMTCPGGCIGGGGQPRFTDNRVREARIAAIYREDEGKRLRKSHENPQILQLYEEFLGKPAGGRPHHLLHTEYTPRPRV